jgi:hypothetical protein
MFPTDSGSTVQQASVLTIQVNVASRDNYYGAVVKITSAMGCPRF